MSEESPLDLTSSEPSLAELGHALFTEPGGEPTRLPRRSWQPPAPEELQALIPQYEILDIIGRGGMGAIYLASQGPLDRLVAIKILSTELDAIDPGFSQRFKNEARAMAKLGHPGIVTIHECGETPSGLHYIVMEFIEGTNVQQMITASRRLHTQQALAIIAHVCDALHYAHQRGIIHRDIKPANILVGYDGSVKVADFGLAKVSTPNGDTRHFLTRSGTTLGTPHYIAPEALIPGAVTDHRADIYATGVMLYHMLTGKLPQGLFELPSIQVQGLDPRLDAVIARAMREDRDLRYATAADMRADIDSLLTQPIPQASVSFPHNTSPNRPSEKMSSALPRRTSTKPPFPFWAWATTLVCLGTAIWLYQRSAPLEPIMQDASTPVGAPAPPPSSSARKADWLAGRWHQMFGDSHHPVYLVELHSDHSAHFAGGSLRTTGRWKLENEALVISWANGARYRLEIPSKRPATNLRGMIFDLDNTPGKNVPVRLQKADEPQNRPASDVGGSPSPPPASATREQPFRNSLGMQFVPVPGTRVLFCIHETRRSDYAAYAAEMPWIDKTWENPVSAYNGMALPVENDAHPVSAITHPEAKAFCEWLSARENRRYRLPTDREWSVAAGIGAQEDPEAHPQTLSGKLWGHFPWGNHWPPEEGNGNYADRSLLTHSPAARGCIETLNDGFITTAPVMSFKPNPFGIYDLGGNVQEHTGELLANGLGILRGGSWFEGDPAQLLSSAREFTRDVSTTGKRPAKWGFRVVLEQDSEDS